MEYTEAKKDLLNCINSYNLPAFMWEEIITPIMQQIQEASKNELIESQQQYAIQLTEFQNKENKKTD